MKPITSRDNAHFKSWRRLVEHGGARRDGAHVVLEGVHLCDAYLRSGGRPAALIVGERGADDAEVADLIARASEAVHYALDDRLFAALSEVVHGVPVLMLVERPDPGPPPSLATTSVLLDRVQDPGNVGSILRSACAAGVHDAYLARGCAAAWSTKVLRAAMGAHFRMRLFEDCDLAALARAATVPLVVTTPHASASLHDVDLTGPVGWLFGHEGRGVAPELMHDAVAVRIPQGDDVESLNVAAAAAICFFEQVRQRRSRGAGP